MADPVHGTTKNYRIERTSSVLADGAAFCSHEQTVTDRWCATCGTWREAKGIIGAMLCVVCKTTWTENPKAEGTTSCP